MSFLVFPGALLNPSPAAVLITQSPSGGLGDFQDLVAVAVLLALAGMD
ncbi:MAG TPA: hypothetical protein PKN50_20845 [Spirochaetota bacterium]|nr:hypothetical protein [Spirochaetota bacterium]HPV42876.1 hypothetical protein [Spirochaetota bacterium]